MWDLCFPSWVYVSEHRHCRFSLVIVNDETVKELHAELIARDGPLLNANGTGTAWYRLKTPFCWNVRRARPLKMSFLWVTHYKEFILLNLVVPLTLLIECVFEEQVMHEKEGNLEWIWFQGLLMPGWVHMFSIPPSTMLSPRLLVPEWNLAKSGMWLHGLWHFAA